MSELQRLRYLALLWSKGQGQNELDSQLLRAQARTNFAFQMLSLCKELGIPPVYDWAGDETHTTHNTKG